MSKSHSYADAGVDIAAADALKREMAGDVDRGDARVLNRSGAFASLVSARFEGLEDPVLVLKTEEPGSKQQLALRHGRADSLARDLIHHLVNDIAVMNASPLYVQDCIVCGKLDPAVVRTLVSAMAEACRGLDCVLVGGETSEQPRVIAAGEYVLSASIVGVAERARILDGTAIRAGDSVLALASNGLHTNGYSLVRSLIDNEPSILQAPVEEGSFLEAILRPHACYFPAIRRLHGERGLHGLAHITGGGIEGNLQRILPADLEARIDLARLIIPPVFGVIRERGGVADEEMLRTFNLGAGLIAVCDPAAEPVVTEAFQADGVACYRVGEVARGAGGVCFEGRLRWG